MALILKIKAMFFGRGRRIRTLTGGFGDRCATINTIPLKVTLIVYTTNLNFAIAKPKIIINSCININDVKQKILKLNSYNQIA